MDSHYVPGSGETSQNGSTFASRKEMRSNNVTGALPIVNARMNNERAGGGAFDFEQMLESLRELFAHDRQIASQPDSTRCGVCYQYFTVEELHYRDEGFYVCVRCEQGLAHTSVPMLRKQQKM